MITIVLAAIIVTLIGANTYLHFFRQMRSKEEQEQHEEPIKLTSANLSSIIQFGEKNEASELTEIKRCLKAIEHKLDKNASRIEYAFQRINRIENALTKNGSSTIGEDIYKKIERLEDFRRESLITIEAMKDYLKSKNKKKVKKSGNVEVEEKIRELIFRGRKA
ncbi:MAG: hypothetical protein N3F05_02190 [Candidatus Diapherotrites archaeon]|nr:hypothetical protein [Candidatus Diapherotrites archaeon]